MTPPRSRRQAGGAISRRPKRAPDGDGPTAPDRARPKGGFYDPWESLPEPARRRAVRKRLAEYVRYASDRVPFYRERLARFDPGAEHPLAKVPALKSDDLRKLLPPVSDKLLADRRSGYTVFQSGGTTGMPKTTLFGHDELEGLYLPNARGFFAVGLTREDRVANLFAAGGLYMTFIHINRMLQQYGCMSFPFSNHTPSDFIHTVARLFRVNCVAGIASVALSCLRDLKKLGLKGLRIEKLYYGGEHLYEADKAEIREQFGIRTILAPGYGTVDSWYLGYQCVRCPTGVFHAHDDQCYLEIVDEGTGRHCGPGETGMAYATAFPRRLTPIVRYRVGDRARWLKDPCPCGRTTPLFELLGRGDDILRIGYDSVDYRFVQEAVSRVGTLSGTAQMQKTRENSRDRLTVRVETETSPRERRRLAQALENEIVSRRPTFRKAIGEGTVWPLRLELVDPGTLRRNPRTGKLIRVIDVI